MKKIYAGRKFFSMLLCLFVSLTLFSTMNVSATSATSGSAAEYSEKATIGEVINSVEQGATGTYSIAASGYYLINLRGADGGDGQDVHIETDGVGSTDECKGNAYGYGGSGASGGNVSTLVYLKKGQTLSYSIGSDGTNYVEEAYRFEDLQRGCIHVYPNSNPIYKPNEYVDAGYGGGGGSGTWISVDNTVIAGAAGGGGGGGGGGGTKVVDNTRKYTKDIFGNEHPTHIGYINGYPDGSVKPEGDITREEITSILYRITNHAYEKPFVATGDAFPDVEAGRWSAHDIEYMADKEIVYGYPDGEFKPSRNLSRAEFAALIFRFTGIEKANIENPFSDFDDTHWAYDEILALTNSGLIEGYPDKTYKPENNITRAEVMTVINKLLGRKPLESYVKSLEFNPYNDLYEDKWYYVTVLEATITHNYWLDNKGYEYKWEDWK